MRLICAKVVVLDSQAIAVTKVMALTDPKRTAPRDLYDLHVLIQANVQEPAELLAAIPDAKDRIPQAMAELWPKIEAMSFHQFRDEVATYLPPGIAASIDEAAFDDMRIEVGTNVERWLRAAETAAAPPSLGGTVLEPVRSDTQPLAQAAAASKPKANKP